MALELVLLPVPECCTLVLLRSSFPSLLAVPTGLTLSATLSHTSCLAAAPAVPLLPSILIVIGFYTTEII